MVSAKLSVAASLILYQRSLDALNCLNVDDHPDFLTPDQCNLQTRQEDVHQLHKPPLQAAQCIDKRCSEARTDLVDKTPDRYCAWTAA